MIAIEDCVELAVRGLEVYVQGSQERLIQVARGDRVDGVEAASVLKKVKKKKKLQDWKEKGWVWLNNGNLKRETESVIVAGQNQSIRKNLIKAKIDKSQDDTLCRL